MSDKIKIVSLNCNGCRNTEVMAQEIATLQPDILLVQEAELTPLGTPYSVRELARQLGMFHAYAPELELQEGTGAALAILSRFPLNDIERVELPRYQRWFRPRERISLLATVDSPLGLVRVANVHLDTRISAGDRFRQLGPVIDRLDSSHLPAILGGDFNSSDVRWLGRLFPLPFVEHQAKTLEEDLKIYDFFSPLVKTGATHRQYPFKLDWIFIRGLSIDTGSVTPISFSDHHAVVCRCSK